MSTERAVAATSQATSREALELLDAIDYAIKTVGSATIFEGTAKALRAALSPSPCFDITEGGVKK